MIRKLSLRQESLADLTTDELGSVAGASGLPCNIVQSVRCQTTYTIVLTGCQCTGYYPSLNAPCTEPINELLALTDVCA